MAGPKHGSGACCLPPRGSKLQGLDHHGRQHDISLSTASCCIAVRHALHLQQGWTSQQRHMYITACTL